MTFTLLTLFPELVEAYFRSSIMARAVERGLMNYRIVNIRDFATDRHRTCDDAPYGGGFGMVMKAEPLSAALDSVVGPGMQTAGATVIYPSPAGTLFTQDAAERLAGIDELVFICGRYEGIDQRIIDLYVHEEITVGDYVLSSGEIAALVIVDAVYRLSEGVITAGSLEEESHTEGLLEYPHYTRPEVFRGLPVPEVLLSGHHEKIRQWRHRQSVLRTQERRPDLYARLEEPGGSNDGGTDGPDQGN
jgi:tRNA (guanine37-N1)-methyltransferase